MTWDESVLPGVVAQVDTTVPPPPQSGIPAEQEILSVFKPDEYGDYEKRLVQLYTGTQHGSQGMNSYLRGAPPFDPSIPHNCKVFQELLTKFRLAHPINVLRGVKNDGLIPSQPIPGQTITNYGFTSTSFDPTVPEQFATKTGPVGIGAVRYVGDTQPIIFDIHVPEGFPCLPVSGLVNSPTALAEHELILPDATKFHVMADFSTPIAGQLMRVLKVVALPPTYASGPPPRQPMGGDTDPINAAGRLLGDSSSMSLHGAEPGDAQVAGQALTYETDDSKVSKLAWNPFKKKHDTSEENRDDSGKWTTDDDAPRPATRSDHLRQEQQHLTDVHLSQNQHKCLLKYQNDRWAEINSHLRGTRNMTRGERPLYDPEMLPFFARNIQKAIMKSPLKQSVDVLRGAPGSFGLLDGPMVGKTITNHGFTSTSFDPDSAAVFTRNKEDSILFDIHVPKGTHAFPMGAMDDSRIRQEHELLLPHGSQFHVVGDEIKTVNGYQCRVLKCVAADPNKDMEKAKAPKKTSAYDVSDEPRSDDGEWSTSGGKGEFSTRHVERDAKLSDDEKEAFKAYAYDGYWDMNRILRGEGDLRDPDNEGNHRDAIKKIDAALARTKLKKPVDVYRGLADSTHLSDEDLTGKTITDNGYSSCSFKPDLAKNFSKLHQKRHGDPGAVMHVHVAKGMQAMPIGEDEQFEGFRDEHELLLPHGTRFHVVGDRFEDKQRVLDVVAVPPKETVKSSAYDPSEQRATNGEWTAGGKGEGEVKDFLDGIGGQNRDADTISGALQNFMGLDPDSAKAHAQHYKDNSWAADRFDFNDPDMDGPDSIPDEDAIAPKPDLFDDGETDAISDYVGPGYHDINAAVRGQGKTNQQWLDSAAVSRGIAGLNSAIKKYTLPKPVEVMRGMHNDVRLPPGDLTGKVITNQGFTSTSFDPTAIAPFLSSTDPDERPVMFDYHLPAGYHCVPTKGMGLNDDEHELIMPHGSQFKVQAETEQSMDEGTGDAPKRIRVLHMVPVDAPAKPARKPRKKPVHAADVSDEKRDDDGKWTSDADKPSFATKIKSIIPTTDAINVINDHAEKNLHLTADQRKAVQEYTSLGKDHSFRRVNEYLRDPGRFKAHYGEDAHGDTKKIVEALASAIDSYKVPADCHVVRGLTNAHQWLPDKVKGQTLTNHGFASTSLDPIVGEVFSLGKDTKTGKPKPAVVMDVYVPKGFHALPAKWGGSEQGKEEELILPDKSRFYVKDEETDEDGVRRLQCIAMPPKSTKSSAREGQPRDERGSWAEGGGPSTERDAKKWLREHYSEYRDALPSMQSKAMLLYSSPRFAVMNGLLQGKTDEELKRLHDVKDHDIYMAGLATMHLTSAINAAPETDKSLTVFRQMGDPKFKKGQVVTDPAFTSASLVNDPSGAGATAEIRLPVGTKALGGLTREMILPPGSRFKVERASRRGERPHYVMVYQLPGATTKTIVESMHGSRFEPMDTRDWTVVGPGLGRCAARQMTDENGQRWYVKTPPSERHARSEVLASELYALAGIEAVDARLALTDDDQIAVASRWVVGTSDLLERMENPDYRAKVVLGFATDAWLGNWDVVGMDYDNIITAGNEPVRIDHGGALLYRAMGEAKGQRFSRVAAELDSMRDFNLNEQAATVFGSITPHELRASIALVRSIDPDYIQKAISSAGFDSDTADHVRDTVLSRRDAIVKYMTQESDVDENEMMLARTSGLALEMGDRVDATVLGMYWGTGTIDQISTSDYGGTKLFPAYHVTSDDGQNDWFPPIALTKLQG